MTGPEFYFWLEARSLTEPAAAALFGVHLCTVARWKKRGTDRVVDLACWALDQNQNLHFE